MLLERLLLSNLPELTRLGELVVIPSRNYNGAYYIG
jgi:hypothetical protein